MRNAVYALAFFVMQSCSFLHENEEFHALHSYEISTIQTFGGTLNDSFQSVVSSSDGGYAVLGFTQSNDFDITDKTDTSFDFWVAKFASDHTLTWSKSYGGSSDDRGADIVSTLDGGYAIFGYSSSVDGDATVNFGIRDFWIVKIDAQGRIMWQKSFGFSGSDYGISLIATLDSGLLLTGVIDVTASGGQGNSKPSGKHAGGDYWAIKLSQTGNEEWKRYFGGSFTDVPFGLIETDANEYIIAGSSDSDDVDISENKGTYDFWVIKIDKDGNLIWSKNYGGTEIDEARAISKTLDGNFLIAGDSRSTDIDVRNSKGAADLWLIKVDNDGTLLWEKSMGGTSFDAGRSVSAGLDTGFIVSGSSRSSDVTLKNEGQNDAWILALNDSGDIIWQHTVGGSEIDVFYDAIQINTNTIVAIGDTRSSNADILENKGFTDGLLVTLKK